MTLIPPSPKPEIDRPKRRTNTDVEVAHSRDPKVYTTLDSNRTGFLPRASESLAHIGVDAAEKRRVVVAMC